MKLAKIWGGVVRYYAFQIMIYLSYDNYLIDLLLPRLQYLT
jgi:hypothetical protein